MSLDWMPLEQHDFVVGGQTQHFAWRALSNSIHREAHKQDGTGEAQCYWEMEMEMEMKH